MPQIMPEPIEFQTRDMTARTLAVRSGSVDEETRSFEAVVATEQLAQVYDYRNHEVIDEILLADGGEFPDSVPMLDNHERSAGISSVMGSATNFRRQGNQWMGRGIVGQAVEGNMHRQQVWRDLLDGHIKAVSIGYQVKNYVDIPPGQRQEVGGKFYEASERTLRITTEWLVHELSLTPIGADSEALIRSQQRGQLRPKKRSFFS